MDAYFPRTNVPRPIYEDVRRYPKFFGKKKETLIFSILLVGKSTNSDPPPLDFQFSLLYFYGFGFFEAFFYGVV